jgi:hypothetical protein
MILKKIIHPFFYTSYTYRIFRGKALPIKSLSGLCTASRIGPVCFPENKLVASKKRLIVIYSFPDAGIHSIPHNIYFSADLFSTACGGDHVRIDEVIV